MGEPGDLRDGVFIVVQADKGILLVKHNYGQRLWSLPGGGVKQGEIVTAAAKRELKEETNIDKVEHLKQIGVFTLIKRYGLVILFYALSWSGYPKANGQEISECGFFDKEKIDKLNEGGLIYPAQFKYIQILLKYEYRYTPIYGRLTDPPTIE